MTITKNSVVFYEHRKDTDYGVVSRIENDGVYNKYNKYWSAWNGYSEDSHCQLDSLTLIGPPILGVFNNEGN